MCINLSINATELHPLQTGVREWVTRSISCPLENRGINKTV